MSLSVNDLRSRGRSKSPGGRDRSRSRDARAPSPAQPVRSSRAKKYYESDSTEESSESESDHRSSRSRHEEKRYEEIDSKYRRAASPNPQASAPARGPDPRYEQDRRDGRHPSHAEPSRYEQPRPADYSRHSSYGKTEDVSVRPPAVRPEYAPPGQYKWEYDHPGSHEKSSRPPAAAAEHEPTRGISLNTSGSFHMELGHGHSPQPPPGHGVSPAYAYPPPSPGYTQPPPHGYYQGPDAARPDPYRTHSGTITSGHQHYEVPEPYKYAEPPQQITYINKTDGRTPRYIQTPYTQIEIDQRRTSRHPSEVEVDLVRLPSQRKEEVDIDVPRRSTRRKEEIEIEARAGHHMKAEVDLDVVRRPSRYKEEVEIEGRRPSRHQSEVDLELVRKTSRHQSEADLELVRKTSRHHDEIAIEERRPSRHPSEVDIDLIRRTSYAPNDYDRRRPATQVIEVHPGGGSLHAPPSPGAGSRTHRLSVSAGASGAISLAAPGQHAHQHGAPPGSPLLEAYHGTYQSMSPMPSPMMLSLKLDENVSDIESLDGDSSDSSRGHRKTKTTVVVKRVSIYDPKADALALAAALNHHTPQTEPIISILPHLSDDHVIALRTEYKKHIKVGGKGINIAKHIKLKVTGNLGKIAYATALGRWESEAHWANFWYQSGSSRRELLIESLMGRTNSEIRAIKAAFSDKRYGDSLEKCMQTELKKDKFRNAVLLALEEKRMEDMSTVSKTLVRKDVDDLYKALVSKDGGETAMIEIIVVRSDAHMRDVLREFEVRYRKNFAREMIQKSRNLVGETLAHILNGVLNRPVRDALLLHQALAETSKDRTELLISRLVRFHWEPKHLERVKIEYRRKYSRSIEVDVEEGTKGEFGDFCLGLLEVGR
ncbi:hypothetical protein MMC32_002650 [Xylographa parallela]|nr:hypothetical protein [Xylographa parallela]